MSAAVTSREESDRNQTPVSTIGPHGEYTGWIWAIPIGHWFMIPVLLLAAFMRTQQISTVGIQWDEGFCRKMVEFSWTEMFYRMGLDTHPPLYYIVLKVWSRFFGNGIVAGRVLTAICGISGVLAMYLFVRTAYRREDHSVRGDFLEADLPAVVAAIVLAVVPIHVIWSQQIRMYSLATALVLWSSYFLIQALKRTDAGIGSWAVYTLTAVLLAYTHYFGLFALAAQYVYAFGYRWFCGRGSLFDRIGPVVMSGFCLSLAFQPWLPYFLDQRDRVDHHFYLSKPSWDVLGSTMHELWIGYGDVPSPTIGLLLSQGFVIILLILVTGRRPADFLIFLSVIIPVISVLVISTGSRSLISSRYFQIHQVFLMAAIAIVACRVPSLGRYFAIGLLGWFLFGPIQTHYMSRENAAKVSGMKAAMVKLDATHGDEPLIVCGPMIYTCVLPYIHEKAQVYVFRPPNGVAFFQGTAVIRDEEYVDSRWMATTNHDYLWTLDAAGMHGVVPVPHGWKVVAEENYPEWYGNLVLRLYGRSNRVEPSRSTK